VLPFPFPALPRPRVRTLCVCPSVCLCVFVLASFTYIFARAPSRALSRTLSPALSLARREQPNNALVSFHLPLICAVFFFDVAHRLCHHTREVAGCVANVLLIEFARCRLMSCKILSLSLSLDVSFCVSRALSLSRSRSLSRSLSPSLLHSLTDTHSLFSGSV
jgi:hypothetical protein